MKTTYRTEDESACEDFHLSFVYFANKYFYNQIWQKNMITVFFATINPTRHRDQLLINRVFTHYYGHLIGTNVQLRDFSGRLWDIQYIPRTFAQTHLARFVNGVQIYNVVGRVWQIIMDTRGNGIVRRIARGWAAFYSAKNINFGDTCVYELINDEVLAFKLYKVVVRGRE
ncbi:DNA-binding pseudobarrel domain superfamily [Abeliophyllum distichum]|uniref:DNA-binding pseudobarrel domain superfamily n=1 Tax=Abeliophyllum distichum TaxID=126358 RepID=A0ABD1Q707_9LAMI